MISTRPPASVVAFRFARVAPRSSRRRHINNRNGKIRIGSLVVPVAVVAVVVFIGIWVFGGVVGEEFSPQKFIMRRFHYWQIPILRVPIWPVSLTKIAGSSDDLARHIRTNSWTGDVGGKPARWDIVTMDEWGQTSFRGDASILTNYLKQPGAVGTESWLDWSKDHPKLAQELWALVARLAHEDLYSAIPALLESARGLGANAFIAEIRQLAAQQCRDLATAETEAGDAERATALVKLAVEIEMREAVKTTNEEGEAGR